MVSKLAELQVKGSALVTAIDDCPEIADGEGSVVTARFITREVNTIARVKILGPDGQIETLEGTTIHPMWSEDRQDWVPLGELNPGEQLRCTRKRLQTSSFNLQTSKVLSLIIASVSLPVYNIEVHDEHVYQVGRLAILAHNMDTCLTYARKVLSRRPDGVIIRMEGRNGAVGMLPGYAEGAISHFFHLERGILRDDIFRKGIELEQWLSRYAAANNLKLNEILDEVYFTIFK